MRAASGTGSSAGPAIAKATAEATDGKSQTELGFRAYFRWVSQRHDEFMLLFGGSSRHEGEFSAQIRRITEEAADAILARIKPTVSYEDLAGADLRCCDLTGADLSGADFTGTDASRSSR